MEKVYVIILDGVGLGKEGKGNAFLQAKTPFLNTLFKTKPFAKLRTHGRAVGLPEFQMGGSEVGHLTIGAGRPVKQLLTIINDEIESGDFFEKPELKKLFQKAKENERIHFVGMVSDGGIHSFQNHIFGLQDMAQDYGIKNVFLHAFLDGRDVPERTAKHYLQEIDDRKIGKIASIGGRFFGMDRDKNWNRTEQAYKVFCDPNTVAEGGGWGEYLDKFYNTSSESDYYVPPVLLEKEGQIQNEDVVICFNFRTDRMRQIMSALCDTEFPYFRRLVRIDPQNVGIFGQYHDKAHIIYALSEHKIENTLGEIVSREGHKQLRISETEKFNHVTTFFSGDHKEPFENEERIMVDSPKCATYAEKPEMSAKEQTDAALKAIEKEDYELVVQNFANGDLVGHSSVVEAGIKAVETVDQCLGKLVPVVLKKGYHVIITADHGNCEEMLDENGEPAPKHSKNLVPFFVLDPNGREISLRETGTLADIAPTILNILHLSIPEEMTGKDLVE